MWDPTNFVTGCSGYVNWLQSRFGIRVSSHSQDVHQNTISVMNVDYNLVYPPFIFQQCNAYFRSSFIPMVLKLVCFYIPGMTDGEFSKSWCVNSSLVWSRAEADLGVDGGVIQTVFGPIGEILLKVETSGRKKGTQNKL